MSQVRSRSSRYRSLPAAAVALVVASGACGAQDQAVRLELAVSEPRPLVDERPPFPLVESFLAVNPTDPENLIASAMSTSADASVLYGSWDGGDRWRRLAAPGGADVFPGGDPVLAFDGNGRAYFSTIAPGLSVWRSTDGGRTWRGRVAIEDTSRYDDRPWIAASRVSTPDTILLHAAAKTLVETGGRERDVIITATSPDGGRTFGELREMPMDSGFLQAVTDLQVRDDGTLLMPYLVNYELQPDGRYRGKIWMRTSPDGGVSWSGPHLVAPHLSYGERGGDRRWKGLGTTPVAVDESGGPFDGTVYIAWSAPIDDRLQILSSRSADGAATWSAPVRVNGGGLDANHSTPMLAVNGDGVLAVSWNDRRHDPADACFHHYVAVSRDGGRTFAEERRVSERPTCPGTGSRWMNGGETQGLVALPDGRFRATWSVGDRHDLRLWTAVVDPG